MSGGGGGGSYYVAPTTTVVQTGTTTSALTPTIINPTTSQIKQDTLVKKVIEFRKSKVIATTSSLPKGTYINVYLVLANGKMKKVGTTRVLKNGGIRFEVKSAGKYKLVQK